MSGWRAASRIARRSVRRNLGRSLLIVALIALPVAAAAVADGLMHTITDRDIDIDRAMGSADAQITVHDLRSFDIKDVLPPGARAVKLHGSSYTGTLRLAAGDRIVRSRLGLVVVGDPLTAHLARLTEGRLPKNAEETLVTRPLAERLGLLDADGDLRHPATARADNGPAVTVTGLAVEPYCLTCADVVAPPDSVLSEAVLDRVSAHGGVYLVDLPAGVDVAKLARTWPMDKSTITTRDTFEDYTPVGGYLSDTGHFQRPVMLFAGLGLIAIVITAGAAFAVGARAQVRELGLVAVNGGTAKHVRRIVLAQGLVLGVLGAATGLLFGAAATVLGMPLWQDITGQLLENPRFGWAELVAAAAVGVLAGVLAATAPAFSVARMHPVDALAGRFHAAAPKARVRLLGVFLVLAGAATVVTPGVMVRARMVEHQDLIDRFGTAPPVNHILPAFVMLAGVMVAVVGLILVMPALVAAVGRLGVRLPLSGRLAVRDAVRHRHRTVAAGTAVMVTVAASIVTAFVFAAQAASAPQTLPPNTALAQLDVVGRSETGAHGPQQLDHVMTNATHAVPGAVANKITVVTTDPVDDQRSGGAYLAPSSEPVIGCFGGTSLLGIGTPELIELATGRRPDAGVRSALAEGKVVSFDRCLVTANDTVSVNGKNAPVTMPAYQASDAPDTEDYAWELPRAFVSREAAAAHGWGLLAESVAITYPAPSDLDAVRAAVEDAGMDLYAGESTDEYLTGLYFLLAGLAGLVAFLGAGMTVALSATDGRTDLATLSALGAQPRRRRTLAGAHALVVTGLGAFAGLVLGVCAGFAAVPIVGYWHLSVPWQHLLITVLAVPLLASVVAVVATPSRLVPRS